MRVKSGEAPPDAAGAAIPTEKSLYSVAVDVWALGMVYFFVFENGRAPSIGNAADPDQYSNALSNGLRPHYYLTKTPQRRIIDLCWLSRPSERPTCRELIKLLAGYTLSPATGCIAALCGRGAVAPAAIKAAAGTYEDIAARRGRKTKNPTRK